VPTALGPIWESRADIGYDMEIDIQCVGQFRITKETNTAYTRLTLHMANICIFSDITSCHV